MSRRLSAQEQYRLGRKIEHDPRSKSFKAASLPLPDKDVHHNVWYQLLNQGSLGACVGFASGHCVNTDPVRSAFKVKHPKFFTAVEARQLYQHATAVDAFDGTYPPDDTGTSALAAMKVLKKMGLIRNYEWAFGIEQAVGLLGISPLLFGIPWHSGMYSPNSKGIVTPKGAIVGGHEICATQYRIVGPKFEENLIGFVNSWGQSWGKQGYFYMTVKHVAELLDNFGDVCRPIF